MLRQVLEWLLRILLVLRIGAKLESLILETKTKDGEGNGTLLQYSCLENPMDGGAWLATVHGVAKSQTRLSDFTFSIFRDSSG